MRQGCYRRCVLESTETITRRARDRGRDLRDDQRRHDHRVAPHADRREEREACLVAFFTGFEGVHEHARVDGVARHHAALGLEPLAPHLRQQTNSADMLVRSGVAAVDRRA